MVAAHMIVGAGIFMVGVIFGALIYSVGRDERVIRESEKDDA